MSQIAPHSIQLHMQKQYITHTSFAPYYGIHKGELEDLERVTERVTYLGPLSHIFCFNYVCTYVWGCMWSNGMHSVRPSTIQSHLTSSTRQLDPQPLWLQRRGLGGRSGCKNSWCWPQNSSTLQNEKANVCSIIDVMWSACHKGASQTHVLIGLYVCIWMTWMQGCRGWKLQVVEIKSRESHWVHVEEEILCSGVASDSRSIWLTQ